MTSSKANRLLQASSPYLLQHAYNPVDWYPWGEEALQKAKEEDKPMIVSIGYSACHWCHVMERESFENEQIAELMNQHYVCIKVDREERPDVDAIYMDAVQAMGMQGGWPLNAFLTPEAKPFYAGTYFPPQNWANLLVKVAKIFQENRQELEESAEQFRQNIATSELKKYGLVADHQDFQKNDLDQMFDSIVHSFDTELGGMKKAPKFPMPSIYQFLLTYAHTTTSEENKEKALSQLHLTLEEMAKGGIYDQIGGGFARYSVDARWFAPHFEKMLYDNAQLVSLYAQAFQATQRPLYQEIVQETIAFVARELTNEEGGFYSALDADSEGEEGKFYIWQAEEMQQIFPDEAERTLFFDYYNLEEKGNWEKDYNILHRKITDQAFAQKHDLSLNDLQAQVKHWKTKLLKLRAQRVRPGLDDKILTSWNALMLNGLVDAYRMFGETTFLELALKNANFLAQQMMIQDKEGIQLQRTYKNGKASIEAYLEDYALCIEAFINLYQATFELSWLEKARELARYTLINFYDEEEGMFFFTSQRGEKLIARKKEIFDNVIPASNSVMAKNLQLLGLLYEEASYSEIAQDMLSRTKQVLLKNVEYLANWGQAYARAVQPVAEIVLVGQETLAFRQAFDQTYFPHKVLIGSPTASNDLPLLENRTAIDDQTTIYVCYNKTCQLPVHRVAEAWEQIGQS